MHAGFSLLTLLPGIVGGSESYVRGLLGAFGEGNGPERATVLAGAAVVREYAGVARGPVSVREMPYWRYPRSTPLRALAIGAGLAAGRLLGRGATADLDVMHHPLTVPVPRSGAATVVTYHDAQHLEHPRFFSRLERLYRAAVYDRAARKAAIVITPSEFTRSVAIERLGLQPERVRASHHGIDHASFGPVGDDDERLLASLDLPESYLVYPANLWPHKNHERLIEALARSANSELGLVLTGGTFGKEGELAATARRAGVAGRVRHLGYVDAQVLPAMYRGALAMLFASLYEGFGSPPLEAMACGCPTMVSRAGALPETCGAATVYFDPTSADSIAEAIDRVAAEGALRDRLREAGMVHAAGFSWSASARRHAAVYREAVAMGDSPDARQRGPARG